MSESSVETAELDSAIDDCLGRVLEAEASAGPGESADDSDTELEDPDIEETDYEPAAHRECVDMEDEGDEDFEATLTRGVQLVAVEEIAGVPLLFERFRHGGPPKPTTFTVARSYVPALEATVKQLIERAPASFGKLETITSAGMRVVKPNSKHADGRACDWDRLTFANAEIAPIARHHASTSATKRRRYWAFAAICRANSCFVLHGRFNREHEDHIHTDNSTGVGFARATSTVQLLQAVLNEIYGTTPALVVDGKFGTDTSKAFDKAKAKVDLAGSITDVAVWRPFLRRSARLAFALEEL